MRLGIWFAKKPSDWIDTPCLGYVSFLYVCVRFAVARSSLCVLPRLWPIMHIFALFIFLLTPQETHPYTHIHAYIYTLHALYARGGCDSKQAFIFVFVLTQTHTKKKSFNSSTQVCFLQGGKKRIWLIFPRLWCHRITALQVFVFQCSNISFV